MKNLKVNEKVIFFDTHRFGIRNFKTIPLVLKRIKKIDNDICYFTDGKHSHIENIFKLDELHSIRIILAKTIKQDMNNYQKILDYIDKIEDKIENKTIGD